MGKKISLKRSGFRLIVPVLLVICCFCGQAMADGKFFYIDPIPASLPYQRAAIFHENGTETLIVQSKYKADKLAGRLKASEAPDIAWIVPVPENPELIEMEALDALNLFINLALCSNPERRYVSYNIIEYCCFGAALFALIWFARCRLRLLKEAGVKLPAGKVALNVFVFCGLVLCLLATLLPILGSAKLLNVDVLQDKQVGIYNVQVIRGNSAAVVTGWLTDNGFRYDSADEKIFAKYVRDGWCFVMAKISTDLSEDDADEFAVIESMVSPLCLRFRTEKPVYPMALTANASLSTEVTLYVMTHSKAKPSSPMELMYYGTDHSIRVIGGSNDDDYELKFDSPSFSITKLHKIFTADQMTEDITFEPDQDQTPYRETLVY